MTIVVSVLPDDPKTYGELKEDIADWLADAQLGDRISRFVRFVESDICKDLRIRGMEKTTSWTVTDSSEALPTDFKGLRRIYVDVTGDDRELDFLAPNVFHKARVFGLTGTPQAYTIEGTSIKFAPLPGTDNPREVKALYIGTFDGFVDDTDSNALLSEHYNLYLYGALAHGFSYLRDNEEAVKYRNMYNEYIATLNRNANRERFMGTKLARIGGPTP